MTSQTFCYHCVEYIKLETCAKFHDHWNDTNKVMKGGPHAPSHIWNGRMRFYLG